MERYRDFQPTGFDPKGLCADRYGIGEFVVLPCTQNRDSECLDRSNFEVALRMLGGESEDVQVHRFGHWGNGWFELILVNPANAEKLAIAEDIDNCLSEYVALDDEHLSELEFNTAYEYWERMSVSQRVEYLQRVGQCIFAARRDELPADNNGALQQLLLGH